MESPSKKALSPSQLGMLERCGEQYRRRYIEGEKVAPGIAMLVGTGTHGAAEFEMNNKAAGEPVPELQAVHDAARDAFTRAYDETGVLWSAEEQEEGTDKVLGHKIDETITLATAYHFQLAPKLEPVPGRVEWKWRVGTATAFDLTGVIDLQDTGNVVRDLKTSGKTPPQSEADVSEQLTFYALAVQELDGELPAAVALDYLIPLKGGVKAVSLVSRRDEASVAGLWARIERAEQVITAGAFTPARTTDWWCDRRWCGYWESCPFAARPVSVAV
jgi:RecB family exonuclease